MRDEKKILEYARALADELEQDMTWKANDGHGYWKADDRQLLSRISARAAAALEFFRQYSGPDSTWTEQAARLYANKGDNQSTESGAHGLGDLLREWCHQVEADITEIVGARAWAETGLASTDLMSQVRRLLDDRQTHPAAAIMLCGAALEITLRAIADARSLVIDRPSLNAYTAELRRAGLITAQDVKDITQLAGLRNAAAHGDFDVLSPERAGLMEQQTNMMLRQLAELV
ncbi:hypothetical protein [Nonomuraea ceibae]|uniref:hypothetical protein n=1 Tax=Nonomuraea ceibae TaxID=1935170 RepID=UPI001C607E61|nr:hypothetical protein [Nonomuraea ceibae]